MTFDDLIAKRSIEPVSMEPGEIADLIRVAQRDVGTAASLVSTDLDWAFAIAYNAILQSSVAYMGSQGYRPRSANKHFNTFRFMIAAMPEHEARMKRLQRFRKKRNTTIYEQTGLVGEAEAHDIIAFAKDYVGFITDMMPEQVRHILRED